MISAERSADRSPDTAMMRAFLDAYDGDMAVATVDWAALKRQADDDLAYELAAAKAWLPKVKLPPPAGHIDAAAFDRLLAKIDSPDRVAARARLRVPFRERSRNYGLAALEAEEREVESALLGLRNETLNKSAWSLARLVNDDLVDADDVEDVLVEAACRAGLSRGEAVATVRGALRRRGV